MDSHWPIEKFKEIDNISKRQRGFMEARKIYSALDQAKSVSSKYIAPPKTTDFVVYLQQNYLELSSYRDPKTKQLLLEELELNIKFCWT